MRKAFALAAVTLLGGSSVGNAGTIPVTVTPQTDDVWVYTFGQGSFASIAATFAGIFEDDDPDRLGYFFLTFDVSGSFDAGGRPARVRSLELRTTMLNSSSFNQNNGVIYDPTYDSVETYHNSALDTDPGRPIELYGVGFRNGFNLQSWRNANFPVSGPEGYSAVPIDFPGDDPAGRDVQNSVSLGFDTLPLAIGTTQDLISPGDGTQRVLDLARWVFTVSDISDGLDSYFRNSLDQGEISLIVSSLQLAGFDGMGGDEIYPRFATLNTFFPVDDAELLLDIQFSPPEDVNGDFVVDIEDLYAWEQGEGMRDINGDGVVNAADRFLLIAALRAAETADIRE